jgi:hypothetical protein
VQFYEGKFAFDITGKDTCHRMFEGSANWEIGGTGQDGVPIVDAIEAFMVRGPAPNVGSVKFYKMEGGKRVPAEFADNGLKGPKGKWIANGRDKLMAAREWLNRCVSKEKKSWIPQYNSLDRNGELIFWVDEKPRCEVKGDGYWDANCIGCYVVNGGKSSSVIEFSPKIRWNFGSMSNVGGNLSSEKLNAMGTPGSSIPGNPCATLDSTRAEGAGTTQQTHPTETMKDLYSTAAAVISAVADTAARGAVKVLTDNIEADLTIVGDPTILPPNEAMWSKNISIVLVNPFFLMPGADSCGEWLSIPTCNAVLSNKAWLCKSITHRIDAGKYTTTIGVYLVAPGIDTPAGSNLGGWDKGWKPNFKC